MVTTDTIYTIQQFVCLSTDTKPATGVPNGSRCLEMDTGDLYIYDAANNTWHQASVMPRY